MPEKCFVYIINLKVSLLIISYPSNSLCIPLHCTYIRQECKVYLVKSCPFILSMFELKKEIGRGKKNLVCTQPMNIMTVRKNIFIYLFIFSKEFFFFTFYICFPL